MKKVKKAVQAKGGCGGKKAAPKKAAVKKGGCKKGCK